MNVKPAKRHVYLRNPKMTFFVNISDFGEYLQNDLDINPNDNCILMTYKLVINKNERLDLDIETEYFESWPTDGVVNDAICELSKILKNNHRFRMVATIEKIKEGTGDDEQLQYIIHVLVNIQHLNVNTLQNSLNSKKVDVLYDAQFYPVAIDCLKQVKMLPNETWCIAPVVDMEKVVSVMSKQSQKDSQLELLKYDDCEYECQIAMN